MKNIIKKILKEELDLTKPVVVFVGGLHEAGYKPIKEQTKILEGGLGKNFTVIPHKYTEVKAAKESIKRNPNCYVVLFSAGCSQSNSISSLVTDKSKMYIVDPYTCRSGTFDSVTSSGVNKNNILGTTNSDNCTGNNVAGTKRNCKAMGFKSTLDCHWDGLRVVGSIIALR
jgi:hypothetical protein